MKRFILFFLFVNFCFSACYEDKGKYDLVDYNDVTLNVVTSLTKKSIVLGDTVRIVPKMTWKYPDRDTLAYDYRWEMGLGNVVSTDRNFEYIPTSCGQFDVNFYMTDRQTGLVFHDSHTSIEVKSPYKVGWLILSEKDNRTSLSYVRRDSWKDEDKKIHYEWVAYPDVYATLYPDSPLGTGPLKLENMITGGEVDEVMVVQRTGGAYYLSGMDFAKVLALHEEFPGSTYPAGLEPVEVRNGGWQDFVLSANGDVYWKRNPGAEIQHVAAFIDIPLYFSGTTNGGQITQFFDLDTRDCGVVLMYDEGNNRVVGRATRFNSNSDSRPVEFTYAPDDPNVVKLTDLTGYKIMYLGDYAKGSGLNIILKEESTGNYYYQNMGFNNSSFKISNCTQELFAGSNVISDNTVYFRIRPSSYLFMGEGSKLYFYDVNTKIVKLFADYTNGNVVEILQDADAGEIGVALDDGNFYIYELSTEVLADENPGEKGLLFHVSDLGRIVDIEWKWGGSFNWAFKRYE